MLSSTSLVLSTVSFSLLWCASLMSDVRTLSQDWCILCNYLPLVTQDKWGNCVHAQGTFRRVLVFLSIPQSHQIGLCINEKAVLAFLFPAEMAKITHFPAAELKWNPVPNGQLWSLSTFFFASNPNAPSKVPLSSGSVLALADSLPTHLEEVAQGTWGVPSVPASQLAPRVHVHLLVWLRWTSPVEELLLPSSCWFAPGRPGCFLPTCAS